MAKSEWDKRETWERGGRRGIISFDGDATDVLYGRGSKGEED